MGSTTTNCQHIIVFTCLALLILIVALASFLSPMNGPTDYVRLVTRVVSTAQWETWHSTKSWGTWSHRTVERNRASTAAPARNASGRFSPPNYQAVAMLGPGVQAVPGALVRGKRQVQQQPLASPRMNGAIMSGLARGPSGSGMQMDGRFTGLTPGQMYAVTVHRFGDTSKGCSRLGHGLFLDVPRPQQNYENAQLGKMNPVMNETFRRQNVAYAQNITNQRNNATGAAVPFAASPKGHNDTGLPVAAVVPLAALPVADSMNAPQAGRKIGPAHLTGANFVSDQMPMWEVKEQNQAQKERQKRTAEPDTSNDLLALQRMNPVMSTRSLSDDYENYYNGTNDYEDYNSTLVGVFTANETGCANFSIFVISGVVDTCGNIAILYGRTVAVRPVFGTYNASVDVNSNGAAVEVNTTIPDRKKRSIIPFDDGILGGSPEWKKEHEAAAAFEGKPMGPVGRAQAGFGHQRGFTGPNELQKFNLGPGMKFGMPVCCGVFARM